MTQPIVEEPQEGEKDHAHDVGGTGEPSKEFKPTPSTVTGSPSKETEEIPTTSAGEPGKETPLVPGSAAGGPGLSERAGNVPRSSVSGPSPRANAALPGQLHVLLQTMSSNRPMEP